VEKGSETMASLSAILLITAPIDPSASGEYFRVNVRCGDRHQPK
jgi:hypothetical protein